MNSMKTTVTAVMTAKSGRMFFSTGNGFIIAVTPGIIRALKILLPMIFPMARSLLLWIADIIEAANSGSEVPTATIVSPITVSLTCQSLAIATAFVTISFAPPIMTAIPTAVTMKLKKKFFHGPVRSGTSSLFASGLKTLQMI